MATRREFIKRFGTLGAAGAAAHLTRLGLINANAQGTPGYKALVCIFLYGGNDGGNMVVPTTPAGFAAYQTMRQSVALQQSVLLPIVAQGTSYGLHPRLVNIRNLYNQNKAALLFNVGTLIRPTTKAQYQQGTATLPKNLYSHSDQQNLWQSGNPSSTDGTGWAGRVNDMLVPNAPFPPGVSVGTSGTLLAAQVAQPVSIMPGTNFSIASFASQASMNASSAALQQILTFDSGVQLIATSSGVLGKATAASLEVNQALASTSPLQTVFPSTSLGQQMAQIAKIMQVRNALGLTRQIFFATISGFDAHSNLIPGQDGLLAQVDGAMGAFQASLVELQLEPNVVTFIESEFGRTGNASQTYGSDHGWGNHMLAVGQPVHGGQAYGIFPTLALGGPDDTANRGVFIPTTSMDQYAATLASWYGVPDASLPLVFPNLPNFATGPNPTAKLGFL